MKNLSAFLLMLCMLFVSCAQPDEEFAPATKTERVAKLGVLRVASESGFAALVDEMKQMGTFDVRDLPQTRSGEVQTDETFVSLREHLIEQGLREFTDEELAEIIADSLEYDPEDSLIVDPYMMAMLNENREVQIADKMYRYVDEGLLIYDAPVFDSIWNAGPGHVFDPENIIWPDSMVIQGNESTVVVDNNGNEAILRPIEYIRGDYVGNWDLIDYPGGGGSSSGNDGDGESSEVQGLMLADKTVVPEPKINRAIYVKGNGDASWLQKGISGLFGTNVVVVNKFDSTHRMKLRMFDMDYLIYKSCGMTVRMQKKSWGIWWRKKAQEFRYGWSAIEIEHDFNKAIFDTPPLRPDGTQAVSKYPDTIFKKFPCPEEEIVLFNVPFVDYDITTGDINAAFQSMTNAAANKITNWLQSAIGTENSSKPIGIYTVFSDDCKMLTVYPQSEQVSYNDGREVVRWESEWDFGFVNVFFNFGGESGFSYDKIEMDFVGHKMDIKRGRVYAAVKYNNDWRVCTIETK